MPLGKNFCPLWLVSFRVDSCLDAIAYGGAGALALSILVSGGTLLLFLVLLLLRGGGCGGGEV